MVPGEGVMTGHEFRECPEVPGTGSPLYRGTGENGGDEFPQLGTGDLGAPAAEHKSELPVGLQPNPELIYLRGGLTVTRPSLELALKLERRGYRQTVDEHGQYQDGHGQYQVEPPHKADG